MFFSEGKRPGSEVDLSPASGAEVGNGWSYTSTLLICLRGVVSEKLCVCETLPLMVCLSMLHVCRYQWGKSVTMCDRRSVTGVVSRRVRNLYIYIYMRV